MDHSPAVWSAPRRQLLELEHLRKLETAGAQYQERKRQYDEARHLAGAVSVIAREDGRMAHALTQQAYHAMQQALQEYRLELHRFTRLVIDRELV